jgi:SAM-dependent MidA family methyltransferase
MVPTILPERIFAPASAQLEEAASPAAAETSRQLRASIVREIKRTGFMSFARFMELALYAPGMGYYAAGSSKLGARGDYVTAPELSPLFGQAIAAQAMQVIEAGHARILELGAGTGRMACDLLAALAQRGVTIERYSILEVSAELRDRQRRTLERLRPHALARIEWLDDLPQQFSGMVIGNEVLDALPVHLVRSEGGSALELGVGVDADAFAWRTRSPAGELAEIASALALPDGYTTEVHLAARALLRTLAERLQSGVALFIDYGFPQREYYHADRRQGTLMCHTRHRAHDDPLVLVGLQDITAHLDFTALADAARTGGLDLLGYTSQAQFLINCGILELLQAIDPADTSAYAPVAARVQQLLSPAEMGELFKAIALGRGMPRPLLGFRSGDRSGALA